MLIYFPDKDLILKVMDSDFPLQDELIGIIKLPVNALVKYLLSL